MGSGLHAARHSHASDGDQARSRRSDVNAPHHRAPRLSPPAEAAPGAILRGYPEIGLEISVHDGAADLLEQGYDMGVRFGDRVDEGMVARRLTAPFREELFVSENYVRRHGVPERPADLCGAASSAIASSPPTACCR